VDPASAATVASWAKAGTRPLHAHVSEQPAENEACLAEYGKTPTAVLAEAGALSEQFTAIHFTHVDSADVALLGEAGATACLCPTTERDLADGVGQARRIAAAGARLATGSDSHAVIDPFEEIRAIELDERLVTGERGIHAATTLLRTATSDGHLAIGWDDAGRIEAGAWCDLVAVDLTGVRLAGTDAERALESVVFGATAADVQTVIASGREVVTTGEHVAMDVAAELKDSIASAWEGA
jgi:cytosine/adenosine deaminase-related metal-dependent hydrolase